MQETRPGNIMGNMVQRRVIYFIIRGMLLFLGCVLLWRMITVISNGDSSNLVKEVSQLFNAYILHLIYLCYNISGT